MTTQTIGTRAFTKQFSRWKARAVQVTDRGRVLGVWTPAPKRPPSVDFLQRATEDSTGQAKETFAGMLAEGKKR
jgi:hypothetical protein